MKRGHSGGSLSTWLVPSWRSTRAMTSVTPAARPSIRIACPASPPWRGSASARRTRRRRKSCGGVNASCLRRKDNVGGQSQLALRRNFPHHVVAVVAELAKFEIRRPENVGGASLTQSDRRRQRAGRKRNAASGASQRRRRRVGIAVRCPRYSSIAQLLIHCVRGLPATRVQPGRAPLRRVLRRAPARVPATLVAAARGAGRSRTAAGRDQPPTGSVARRGRRTRAPKRARRRIAGVSRSAGGQHGRDHPRTCAARSSSRARGREVGLELGRRAARDRNRPGEA